MNQYKKMAKNTFWFAFGEFGSKAITFFMVPLYTAVLARAEYGQVDIFNITISLLVPLITLTLADSMLRFYLDEKESKSEILSNAVTLTMFLYLIFIFISFFIIKNEFFVKYNNYFYSILLLTISNQYLKVFAKGLNKINIYAISGIIQTISLVSFNIYFLVFLKSGVSGYFNSILLSNVINFIFLFTSIKPYKYISIKNLNKKKMKEMLIFSIPLIPNVLNWWIMNVSDRYLLSYFLGYDATGLYSASYKIPTILTVFNAIFYQAWQISAIENVKADNRDNFYSNIFKVNMGLMIIVTGSILLILKPFMDIYVAEDYFIAYKYVPFLLLGTIFSSFSSFFGVGYLTSKKTKQAFTTSIFGSVINVSINIIFIPIIGIQAASISTFLSFFFMWLVRVYQTRKFYKIKIDVIKLILSLTVLFTQTYFIISTERYNFIYQIILYIILILIFLQEEKIIFSKAISYLKKRKKKASE